VIAAVYCRCDAICNGCRVVVEKLNSKDRFGDRVIDDVIILKWI
jgi:hypothetical protein